MICSPMGIGCLSMTRAGIETAPVGLGEHTGAASWGAPFRRSAIHSIGKKWQSVLR